jgi:hypothetical protein
MTLTKSTNILDKVSGQYRPYIEAMRTPDLASSKRTDNVNAIVLSLSKALLFKKVVSQDDKSDRLMAETLLIELQIKMKHLRHGQIELAFRNGIIGEYGEFFGVNPATMFQWCKAFINSRQHKEAVIEWNKLLDEEAGIKRAEKPTGKILELEPKQILDFYEEYLSESFVQWPSFPPYSFVYYDAICKIKGVKTLINSSEVRAEIKRRTNFEYENKLKSDKIHIKEPDRFKELMLNFTFESPTFIHISKKLALSEYFKECKFNGVDPI